MIRRCVLFKPFKRFTESFSGKPYFDIPLKDRIKILHIYLKNDCFFPKLGLPPTRVLYWPHHWSWIHFFLKRSSMGTRWCGLPTHPWRLVAMVSGKHCYPTDLLPTLLRRCSAGPWDSRSTFLMASVCIAGSKWAGSVVALYVPKPLVLC